MHSSLRFMPLLAALMLAACGGGGGSGSVSVVTPPRTQAISLPQGGYVAADASGNVYATNYLNLTVVKVDTTGNISLMGGLSNELGTQDGTGAGARFTSPGQLAVDKAGNVYVGEGYYTQPGTIDVAVPRAAIRKITPGGAVTTFAGSPSSGQASDVGEVDGVGTAARLSPPSGLAVDPAGNVFVAEYAGAIRKITPEGVVTTFAGAAKQPGSVDGVGTAARFYSLDQMAADAAGNLYVVEVVMIDLKISQRIRKITPAGVVSTFATDIPKGTSNPGIAVQPSTGIVYLASGGVIYRFNAAGVATNTGLTYPEATTGNIAFSGANELVMNSKASLLKFKIE